AAVPRRLREARGGHPVRVLAGDQIAGVTDRGDRHPVQPEGQKRQRNSQTKEHAMIVTPLYAGLLVLAFLVLAWRVATDNTRS
ncbi:MAG: hypothetical protein ACREVF_07205, partial [Burkholderiales bacterium]